MRLSCVALAVVACSGSGGGDPQADEPAQGIRHLAVSIHEDSGFGDHDRHRPTYYLELRYGYKPITPIDHDKGGSLEVRTACQVGAIRFLDDSMEYDDHLQRRGGPNSTPFILSGLTVRPSLCDLGFYEIPTYGAPPQLIHQVCAYPGKPPVKGPCPVNPVLGDGTGGGFSVPSLEVKHEDADPQAVMMGQEHLVLSYVVQAHRDQDPGAWVEVAIACEGGSSDSVSHSEAGKLHAGESFTADQIKLEGRVPPPETPCTVTFTALAGLQGERTPIETFCYRDHDTTRGECN